ncbi:hypothetical protein J6590_087485 [Homalodisca vitripennis]|nr:hypothetical protein J6590_087485 [Homalodisca vitripennis]
MSSTKDYYKATNNKACRMSSTKYYYKASNNKACRMSSTKEYYKTTNNKACRMSSTKYYYKASNNKACRCSQVASSIHPSISVFRGVSSVAIVSIETRYNSNNYSTDVTQLQFHRTPEYCEQRSYCQH